MTLDTTVPDELAGPDLPPRPKAESPGEWVRANLFRTWWDSLLTLVLGSLLVWGVFGLVRFLAAADFTILRTNLALFMVGRFPRDMLWRPAASVVIAAALIGFVSGVAHASARAAADESGLPFSPATLGGILRRFWPIIVVLALILSLTRTFGPTLVAVLAVGVGWATFLGAKRSPRRLRKWSMLVVVGLIVADYLVLVGFGGVGWDGWGGLQINLFLTVGGIVFAFPLGLLLALGRRSSLPALRTMSVTYIELIRGVPLITLLLMGIFAIGFFLPDALKPGPVVRVLMAITLFESAYIAEVVRGGLQAVPRGQHEASQALGMPPWKTMRLIVLPQALRATARS